MSPFLQSVRERVQENRASLQDVTNLIASNCNALGKPVEISVEITSELAFTAFAERLRVVEPVLAGGKRGGLYRICISEGLITRLAYVMEISAQILDRIQYRSSNYRAEVIVHPRQEEEISALIRAPNFFGLDLWSDLVNLEVEHESIECMSESIERKFWAFEIGSEPIGLRASIYLDKALEFLVLHEGGHIARGHLDYRASTGRGAGLPTEADIDPKMLQAMEIDADLQAMTNQYAVILREEFGDNTKSYTRLLITVYALIFSLFDLRSRTANSYRGASHPDPDGRLQLAWYYLGAMLEGETGRPFRQIFSEAFGATIAPVTRVLRELGIRGGSFQQVLLRQSDDGAARYWEEYGDWSAKHSVLLQQLWVDRAGTSSGEFGRRYEHYKSSRGE